MNSIYKTRLYKSLSSQRKSSRKKFGRNTSSIRRFSSRKTIKSFDLHQDYHKRNKYDFLLRHDTGVLKYLYFILQS